MKVNFKMHISFPGMITFLSDFGDRDWFVAAVKGEILKINKKVLIVDITHRLVPYDINSAAFVLKSVYRNFPAGTIHLVVIDPGVGSERKPIIVESAGYYFVGPDNGVFSYIYNKDSRVYKINQKKRLSSTFHARDIFGPSAARLSKGLSPEVLGINRKDYVKFEFPKIKKIKSGIQGEVIYIDHFGNLITNIPNSTDVKELYILKRKVLVKRFYGEGKMDEIIAIKGSCGFYEIASNKRNVKAISSVKIGMKIMARCS